MAAAPREIVCTACGADTFLRREPVYEGFRKTGERLLCMACGHEYGAEPDVPFKTQKRVVVFTEADKSRAPDVFAGEHEIRNCRRCLHYVVNPFVARCGLTQKIVAATDSCGRFEAKPAPAAPTDTTAGAPDPA